MGRGVVTNRFQMAALLRVNSFKAGFLGFIRMVSTNEVDAAASVALQAKPGPASQARGVHTGSSNICHDRARAKNKSATILLLVEVIMGVVAGNGVEREL